MGGGVKTKQNSASGTCGTAKALTLCYQNPRKKEDASEKVLKEIMTEKFPNVAEDINLQFQEA